MDLITDYNMTLLVLVCLFGFFMAWGVGANDVANAMGTSVGSKALTIKQAIVVAMIFEFAGAYLAGGEVTATIRKGIISSDHFTDSPHLLVYGMMSALLAAGTWLLIASLKGWPVSTTHSIVGAIVGFASVGVSVDAVNWSKVGDIAASWLIAPILAGSISFAIFKSVQKLVLSTNDPFNNAKKYVPYYIFLVGSLISMVTMLKGLKHVFKDAGMSFSFGESAIVSIGIGVVLAIIGALMLRKVKRDEAIERTQGNRFYSVEKVFAVLMVFTACAMAFAHGSNDVANAVGPLAAVVSILKTGVVGAKAVMPAWVLLLGAAGIVVGLATYGYKVMATIGGKITELTPSRGFAAELGAAATVVVSSGTGLPVSTTQVLVGAVLGVGMARGIGALNLRVIGSIFMSWVITLPIGAILAIIFFFLFKGIFGP